jgi:hypothetical protein
MNSFPIEIVSKKISKEYLLDLAKEGYEKMIKFVVDIEKEIIAVGGEMHADAEVLLLEQGSEQKNLWGANLWFYRDDPNNRVEFVSLINIRPRDNNKSIEIESIVIKNKVKNIAEKLLLAPNESVL